MLMQQPPYEHTGISIRALTMKQHNSSALNVILSSFNGALAVSLLLATVLIAAYSNSLAAETITVPVASQAPDKQSIERPKSGLLGSQVVKKFGEPLAVNSPVGEPPISRWEYADFYVYFEYNHVVHTVLKHRPRS